MDGRVVCLVPGAGSRRKQQPVPPPLLDFRAFVCTRPGVICAWCVACGGCVGRWWRVSLLLLTAGRAARSARRCRAGGCGVSSASAGSSSSTRRRSGERCGRRVSEPRQRWRTCPHVIAVRGASRRREAHDSYDRSPTMRRASRGADDCERTPERNGSDDRPATRDTWGTQRYRMVCMLV